MNTEMVPLVITCSTGRRILPEEVQSRNVDQNCPTAQIPRHWPEYPHLGPTITCLSSPVTRTALHLVFFCHKKFLLLKAEAGENTNMLEHLSSSSPELHALHISHIPLTTTPSWVRKCLVKHMRKLRLREMSYCWCQKASQQQRLDLNSTSLS